MLKALKHVNDEIQSVDQMRNYLCGKNLKTCFLFGLASHCREEQYTCYEICQTPPIAKNNQSRNNRLGIK